MVANAETSCSKMPAKTSNVQQLPNRVSQALNIQQTSSGTFSSRNRYVAVLELPEPDMNLEAPNSAVIKALLHLRRSKEVSDQGERDL